MQPQSETVVALRKLLQSIPQGPVAGGIDQSLSEAWDDLKCIGRDGAMTASKIWGRLEKVEWNPPILSFQIERHAGMINGSSRVAIQHWEVDVENGTCNFVRKGHRQLFPMAKRWNPAPTAQELASHIRKGLDHQGLRWRKDGKVTINRGIIPACAKETKESRAQCLNATIGHLLGDRAWREKHWRSQ